VAEVDIAFATKYVTAIKSVVQPEWTSDRLASLREVGDVNLGGVL